MSSGRRGEEDTSCGQGGRDKPCSVVLQYGLYSSMDRREWDLMTDIFLFRVMIQ